MLIFAALGAGFAYYRSTQQVPVYTATATLRVQPGTGSDEFRTVYYGPQLAGAHSRMLTEQPVMQLAAERLGLDMSPRVLAGLISVRQVPDTTLIRLSATYVDPIQAAQIANAAAESYVIHNDTIQQGRYADYLQGVQSQMAEMAAQIETTSAEIAALGTPITDQEHAELARLETVLAGYRSTHATLWNNYEQMRLTAALSTDSIVLFERAQAPGGPNGTSARRDIALAAAVGAALAAGFGFLIEYLDETVKTPEDVQQALGLNTLGAIGRTGRENADRIVAERPRSPISESYRRLRTNVRFSSLDRPLSTLLITSANAGEGKSAIAANLATALAQDGLRVIVVDADLRRPRQESLFGIQSTEGLTQSLLDGRLDGNLTPVKGTDNLSLLPSGELPPNPAEMLGSRRMQSLLFELTNRVDVVIVDSPPLLPVTDAAVLSQNVDGVLLVIDSAKTRRGAALHAVESLRQVGANVLGVVLNRVPQRRAGYAYYYHYDQAADKPGKRRRRFARKAARQAGRWQKRARERWTNRRPSSPRAAQVTQQLDLKSAQSIKPESLPPFGTSGDPFRTQPVRIPPEMLERALAGSAAPTDRQKPSAAAPPSPVAEDNAETEQEAARGDGSTQDARRKAQREWTDFATFWLSPAEARDAPGEQSQAPADERTEIG
jgi:non-specific protein-tyrosine kinase